MADDEPAVEPLAFDRRGGSVDRAEAGSLVLQPRGRFAWIVQFIESANEHYVELYRDCGRLVGRCDCRGFRYGAGVCAHLWGVKIAADGPAAHIHDVEAGIEGVRQCPTCGHVGGYDE